MSPSNPVSAEQIVLLFLAVCARWAPLFANVGTTPMQWVPAPIRLVLLLCCALLSFSVLPATQLYDWSQILWTVLVTEFAVGLLLMFQLQLLFMLFSFWGRLLDQQIGFSAAGILNPGSQDTEPLLLSGFMLLAFTLFFSLGLHQQWLSLVAASYQWFPLGTQVEAEWLHKAVLGFGSLLLISVSLFSPVVIALFLFDLMASFLSRNMPQMNVYFVMMPLKIMLGFIVIKLAVVGFADAFMRLNQFALHMVRITLS
jgi:flagellar biosynthesis protein FliR